MKVNWGVLPIFLVAVLGGLFLFSYRGPHEELAFFAFFAVIFSMFLWNGWRNALLKRRLKKEGLPGTARLIRTETTGTRSGNNPELKLFLEITGQGGEIWEASVRQIIPQSQLYAMAPGTVFAVLYDPRARSKVVLNNRPQAASVSAVSTQFGNGGQRGSANVSVSTTVSSTAFSSASPPDFSNVGDAAATVQAYQQMKAAQDAVQQRLASVGTLAKAKVLTCVPLPATINHKDPLMLLMLEIQPDHEPAFSGQVSGFIDATRTDRYAPGSIIYVKYDPADKSKIALVGSERPA